VSANANTGPRNRDTATPLRRYEALQAMGYV
jgi:hypothetical protein